MKFLTAYYSEAVEGELADRDEVVMPGICIGSGPCREFMGLTSYLPSPLAKVVASPTGWMDVDALTEDLQKQYPGLPPGMLEDRVVDTLVAIADIPVDSIVSVEVYPAKCTLLNIETHVQVVAWEGKGPEKYA